MRTVKTEAILEKEQKSMENCLSCWTFLRTLKVCAMKDNGLNSLIVLHPNFYFSSIMISPLLDFPLLILFLLCLSMAFPLSISCPMKLLYYSPIAAITNYYEHSNIKQRMLLFFISDVRSPEFLFTVGVRMSSFFLEILGESISLSFQILQNTHDLWFLSPFCLQS